MDLTSGTKGGSGGWYQVLAVMVEHKARLRTNGVINRGGGGGGASYGPGNQTWIGSGGSGIVIVRYAI
jgi:hypothetical protein